MPGNFLTGCQNFSLLGVGPICIPINIFELFSGMQLSYLETDPFNSDFEDL